MTDASVDTVFLRAVPSTPDRATTRPERSPYAGPVFISDCITPLGGETLLSLMWKRLDRQD
jgi:hypothetical protein